MPGRARDVWGRAGTCGDVRINAVYDGGREEGGEGLRGASGGRAAPFPSFLLPSVGGGGGGGRRAL